MLDDMYFWGGRSQTSALRIEAEQAKQEAREAEERKRREARWSPECGRQIAKLYTSFVCVCVSLLCLV